GGAVDVAQLVLDAERAELDAVRAVRVGLEDLRAGADVFAMDIEHDLRTAEIQLVVALVDEDAFGIEHRPHRSIEEVDVLVGDCLYEVLHKQKPHAGSTWGRKKFEFVRGDLAFFKLVASGPKSLQRNRM